MYPPEIILMEIKTEEHFRFPVQKKAEYFRNAPCPGPTKNLSTLCRQKHPARLCVQAQSNWIQLYCSVDKQIFTWSVRACLSMNCNQFVKSQIHKIRESLFNITNKVKKIKSTSRKTYLPDTKKKFIDGL